MMTHGRGPRRSFVAAMMAVLAMAALSTMVFAQGNPNPGVIPPEAKVLGKTYGEWGDIWWNWAVQFPPEMSPLLDTTGEFGTLGQEGQVWFLAGVGGGGSAERTLTVPAGKFLFFPLVNTFFAAEGTEEKERADVNAFIDGVSLLEASLDGVPLRDLFRYRAESPEGGFVLTLPTDSNLFGAPAGDYKPAVSAGYYLLLAPLSVGEHELHFRAVVGDPDEPDFEVDVIYHLTVAPQNK
jgi:hypothetical protein